MSGKTFVVMWHDNEHDKYLEADFDERGQRRGVLRTTTKTRYDERRNHDGLWTNAAHERDVRIEDARRLGKLAWVSDSSQHGDRFFVVGTPRLKLLEIASGRIVSEIELGQVETIYDFPVASNLVFHGGAFHIAWIKGEELRLSTWKPGSRAATHVVLQKGVGSNTSISAAVAGDTLLVSFHAFDRGAKRAVIRTLTKTLTPGP